VARGVDNEAATHVAGIPATSREVIAHGKIMDRETRKH
jgi:hypothetical protein